jgi:hypothetical protein
MISADKIVQALKKESSQVLLHKGTCCERVWRFNCLTDLLHCLSILSNQIALVSLGMADTRRVYNQRELNQAYHVLKVTNW